MIKRDKYLKDDGPKNALSIHASEERSPDSKLADISEVLTRPEIQELKKEYRLFIHLLIVAEGSMTGTSQQIGNQLSTEGRNVKGWAKELEMAGIATIEKTEHKQITLCLSEPYFSVASRRPTPTQPSPSPSPASECDPEIEDLITFCKTAKATGHEIEITTTKRIPSKKSGKPSHN